MVTGGIDAAAVKDAVKLAGRRAGHRDHTGRSRLFYAFDCLMHEGQDLRAWPLVKRKEILERIVRDHPRILLARHFDRDGSALFRLVCDNDLEGIVAKRKNAAYGVD